MYSSEIGLPPLKTADLISVNETFLPRKKTLRKYFI